jgi:biotin carboxylase
VRGVATTRDVLLDVLRSEEFGSGRYSTDFLARRGAAAGTVAA